MHNLSRAVLYGGIFIVVLYALTILSALNSAALVFSGILPPLESLQLFVALPYRVLAYSDTTLELALLALNIILLSVYLICIVERIIKRQKQAAVYGISSSLLTIFSIGCVTCGSLLSPLMLVGVLGLPLAAMGYLQIGFAIGANLLLIIGIYALSVRKAH